MNKEQQKDEIILTVKKTIFANMRHSIDGGYVELDDNDIDHIAEQSAENLYNLGYRKTFTSDLASETQKAFKEGYEKAREELLENGELVSKEWHDEQVLHAENEIARLQKKLSDVLVCIKDTNNNIDVERLQKQAVKEFAERLQEQYSMFGNTFAGWISFVASDDIDELLKEYEQ